MRINNIDSRTSSQSLIILIVLAVVITFGYIASFYYMSFDHSLMGFFQWLKESFSTLWSEDITIAIIFAGFPLLIYGATISTVIYRKKALNTFDSMLNIKYVEFLYDRVNFVFNRPQYNIICSYDEINELKMTLHTILVHNKYGSYPAVNEIELKFKILNNKTFQLTNVPLNLMKLAYAIVDYGRRVENFSYEFKGVGEVEDVKEKIDDYLNKGFKQILATGAENGFKFMSIIFFAIGIFFFWMFKDIFQTDGFGFAIIPAFIFMGISFIFDIFLIADKIKERKYKV